MSRAFRTKRRRPRNSKPRTAPIVISLLTLACLSLPALAHAQLEVPRLSDEELAALPLVGVHVTVIAPAASPEVTILLPRPADVIGSDHLALLLDECLVPTGLAEVDAEDPLGLVVSLQDEDRCATTAVVVFDAAAGQALATAAVVVRQATAPPLPDGLALATLSVDRMGVPPATSGADALATATVLRLTLTNTGHEELAIDELLEEQALVELAGPVFTPAPDAYDGTWASLQSGVVGFSPAALAPGAKVEYVLVLGASGRLATGSWAVTVGPGFEVVLAGERYSLVLDQASIVRTLTPTP